MQAKSSIASILLGVFLALSPLDALAQSTSAAPWPSSAQGRTLPRPDWVLAIPARRNDDGTLSIWERSDDWTREWRVPTVVDGLRVVTLLGDSEDRKRITPEAIDQMLVDQMEPVMAKYGAPALALVVTDGSSTAVAGYMPGWQASWDEVGHSSSLQETRTLAADVISAMFSDPYSAPTPSGETGGVHIQAFRQNPQTGGMDYRIVVMGSGEMIQYQLAAIAAMPGTVIYGKQAVAEDSLLVELSRDPTAPALEDDLATFGLAQLR